ncbi:MBL fold metallo-hydrolase [Actinoplanes lobatus]|uniref:Glyoxylase-like metal-dependent hydrolase (Beta-lactamase superfamily II) n=1 Tax=Actinoplanes lobatus TaxID=113568 RepID=A0A7W7H8W1_9ACTN|nr:MBL fold metallo-hydrolase [Actinoplanes lobatus]MBB4746048.1 glyoxylase-like metal-dependent hydrolase (beta-lactamase superfamily II) [Actinoplanes lobatus]GGN83546.1 MBL fold metallo-hydrolase [Actinoplanes lobatus]GIE42384.1 MBL fold metallo-hydrolase [Actinoplanes lobatus]
MREVVDGVFELRVGYANVHVVVTDDGLVLVDTGLPGRSPLIERALRKIRRSLGEVTTILVTHHHTDHVGNLADLRRRTGARVIAHAADAVWITGHSRPAEPVGRLAKLAVRLIGRAEPTKIDQLITVDGFEPLPGFTALHTPGHTRGHVSYLLDRSGGILFAGDAAASRRGQVTGPAGAATADPARAGQSLARLAELEFDHAVFGHGRAVSGGAVSGRAVEAFRKAVTG